MHPRLERKARIRRIRRENTETRRVGRGQYRPRFKVDHQSFTLEFYDCDRKHADWVRTQLAVALNRFKFGD